jgi:hypothetical protein
MDDFLDLLVEKSYRLVKVKEIKKKRLKLQNGDCYKVAFLVEYCGKQFTISDCWVDTEGGVKKIQGLWLPIEATAILPTSTLGKLLNFYGADSLQELSNKELKSYPDGNGFLVLVACEQLS